MSKNNFKKDIQERFKGRGNTWVKVSFESEAYSYIEALLDTVEDKVKSEFISHNQREGFSWMRYKKVIGNADNPILVFEVRIKGSKIDQPEYEINIPDKICKKLELLGNTPVKLELEKVNKSIKTKNISKSNTKKNNSNVTLKDDFEIDLEVKIIKEAALTRPSDNELKEWYTFLKANDLYEESAWQ